MTGVVDVVCVNTVNLTVGCERVGGLAKGGMLLQTRDKGGWVLVTMSKEAGSPSK
jgi:hypothetical protein